MSVIFSSIESLLGSRVGGWGNWWWKNLGFLVGFLLEEAACQCQHGRGVGEWDGKQQLSATYVFPAITIIKSKANLPLTFTFRTLVWFLVLWRNLQNYLFLRLCNWRRLLEWEWWSLMTRMMIDDWWLMMMVSFGRRWSDWRRFARSSTRARMQLLEPRQRKLLCPSR